MTDRDQDGIPDAEQLTVEEIEAVDRHFGMGLLALAKDKNNLAPKPGRQRDSDFDPDEYDYDGTMRIVVIKHKQTGQRMQVNYTRLVKDRLIEIRVGHSIEGGVQGGRADSIASAALSKLGTFGSFAAAILGAGGSAPALLLNAGVALLRKTVKGKRGNALIERLLGKATVLLLALAFAGQAFSQVPPLVLDHDFLLSMVQSREPEGRIVYTPDWLELRTRRSIMVGWVDAVLTARFERHGDRVQLIAQTLHAGPLGRQTGRHFLQARAGLLKLVNVKTAAESVEIRQVVKGRKDPVIHAYPVE